MIGLVYLLHDLSIQIIDYAYQVFRKDRFVIIFIHLSSFILFFTNKIHAVKNLSNLFIPILVVPFLMLCTSKKPIEQSSEEIQWESLFNGEDLTGWTMKIFGYEAGENFGNTFRVEEGILQVRYDQYDQFDNRFGALYFNREFKNFRLRVEYRFLGETAPGAPEWGFRDSGIQYHGQGPGMLAIDQPFPICLEYNLHGGNGQDDRPVGQICANGIKIWIDGEDNSSYCTPPAVERTFHGDQWVTAEIESKDGVFRHFVNGEEILQFSNPRFDITNDIARTMMVDGDSTVLKGFISLQSNSHPIDFRKIEIVEYQ